MVTMDVSAMIDGNGVYTGIYLQTGDDLIISATGTWCFGLGRCNGPDGTIDSAFCSQCRVPDPSWRVGNLVGRIGTTGPWFIVNSSYQGVAANGGFLYLGINDQPGAYGDNSGTLTVTISALDHYCVACEINYIGHDLEEAWDVLFG